MTLDALLPQLDSVRPRGNGRYSAICPAHADKSPSLSVSGGEKGILLKCWAGCTVDEICASLGIAPKGLFYDASLPRSQRPTPRPPKMNRISLAFQFEIGAFDLRLRAERILDAAKNLDGAVLTDDDIKAAIGHVGQAHADHERAELFEHIADTLRIRDFTERIAHEHARVA